MKTFVKIFLCSMYQSFLGLLIILLPTLSTKTY